MSSILTQLSFSLNTSTTLTEIMKDSNTASVIVSDVCIIYS